MDYVHISGGKDSTAMAILLHQQGVDFKLVFADTGAEFPETYWMVVQVARVLGKKLYVVSNGSFFEHLVARGFYLPGLGRRWCTQELKVVPLMNFCDKPGAVVYVGLRADEPQRLVLGSGRKKLVWKHVEVRYPLVEAGIGKKEAYQLCKRYDLLNPLYRWRSSVSCFCCPFQRKRDWLGLLRHHPELYTLAEQWEELAGRSFKDSYSLRQLRLAEEQQLSLWPEEAEPCAICIV